MKNYVFGFSLTGLILYVLQLFPNIIWMLIPPANNVLVKNSSLYPILNKKGEKNSGIYIGLAIIFLAGYYISWIFYYQGVVSPWLLIIGLAAMPPLYFLFVGLWMKNYIVILPCIIFEIAHIAITCSNYLNLYR